MEKINYGKKKKQENLNSFRFFERKFRFSQEILPSNFRISDINLFFKTIFRNKYINTRVNRFCF